MSHTIHYPESPLFVIAHAVDTGLYNLEHRACHRLGAQYLVRPKDVLHTTVTWFGMQTAMRIDPSESVEHVETAFEFVSDPKRFEQLRELLMEINKRAPNADVPKIAAQVASAFNINENAAVLILGIRYAILRPGAK